jgi:hypothetical protein
MSIKSAASRFRFTLRELLAATALLAVGFTWPLLLIIVVPLLLAAILSRIGLGELAPIATATSLSLTLGIVCSLLYWRYPFRPPALLSELREISVVEQLSEVGGLNPARGMLNIVQVAGLPAGSTVLRNTDYVDNPTYRILRHLRAHNIGIELFEPLSAELAYSVWRAADEAGMLLDGSPERTNTKTLNGFIGIARLKNGSRIAFATLAGDEYSNDHYPYYEFVIRLDDPKVRIVNLQWFYFDIAGMEGMTWEGVAVVSYLILLPAAIVFQIARYAIRRNRPQAADHLNVDNSLAQ